MDLLISLLFPLVPIAAVWGVVRYGPVRSRWWRRERPLGFALFVGGVCFLVGFIGPMIVAPGASFMGHCAATVGGGGGDEDPVRDRLSAWKLSPALAPVWVILNPTVSPEFLAVRLAGTAGHHADMP